MAQAAEVAFGENAAMVGGGAWVEPDAHDGIMPGPIYVHGEELVALSKCLAEAYLAAQKQMKVRPEPCVRVTLAQSLSQAPFSPHHLPQNKLKATLKHHGNTDNIEITGSSDRTRAQIHIPRRLYAWMGALLIFQRLKRKTALKSTNAISTILKRLTGSTVLSKLPEVQRWAENEMKMFCEPCPQIDGMLPVDGYRAKNVRAEGHQ